MFSYPLNVYFKAIELEEGSCRYLHYGIKTSVDDSVFTAQERSTQYIIDSLIHENKTLLEVGIGLGDTLNRLNKLGYLVTGITPDNEQIEFFRNKYSSEIEIHRVSFEAYSADKLYDTILFQESAQYIDPLILISKCFQLLNPGGQLIVIDEFPSIIIPKLEQALAGKFDVKQNVDLTSQAYTSVRYLIDTINKHKKEIELSLNISANKMDSLLAILEKREKEYINGEYKYLLVSLIKQVPGIINS